MARPRTTSREALGVMAIGKFFEGLMGGMKARQEREIEEKKLDIASKEAEETRKFREETLAQGKKKSEMDFLESL